MDVALSLPTLLHPKALSCQQRTWHSVNEKETQNGCGTKLADTYTSQGTQFANKEHDTQFVPLEIYLALYILGQMTRTRKWDETLRLSMTIHPMTLSLSLVID